MPFLTNLADLKDAPPFAALDSSELLRNLSEPNTLKQAQGLWARATADLAQPAPQSVQGQIAAFNQHAWPSRA